MAPVSGTSNEVQVKFKTFDEALAVPDVTVTVPGSADPKGLTDLVKSILAENGSRFPENLELDFLLRDELIRVDINAVLIDRGETLSDDGAAETVHQITYVEKLRPPEPKRNVNHDDWVAGVSARGNFVLSACYDNTVAVWNAESGAKLLTIPGHAGPCRSVAWIDVDDDAGTFVSTSHDQTVLLHRWNVEANAIEAVNTCKGHERSVDCVDVDPTKSLLATGSFDTRLKIWGANVHPGGSEEEDEGDPAEKRARSSTGAPVQKAATRTPVVTLAGHKEGISGTAWMGGQTEVCSSSWDHTLRIWDLEIGGLKSELVGNKSFFGVSYSPASNLLLTAAAERTIKGYDPRCSDGLLVKSAYGSHQGWVTCVDWCEGSDKHFVSGSHDMILKMWDARSYKVPLFDLSGHSDRILCCDWSVKDVIVSGGADNDMKIFKANVPIK